MNRGVPPFPSTHLGGGILSEYIAGATTREPTLFLCGFAYEQLFCMLPQ